MMETPWEDPLNMLSSPTLPRDKAVQASPQPIAKGGGLPSKLAAVSNGLYMGWPTSRFGIRITDKDPLRGRDINTVQVGLPLSRLMSGAIHSFRICQAQCLRPQNAELPGMDALKHCPYSCRAINGRIISVLQT